MDFLILWTPLLRHHYKVVILVRLFKKIYLQILFLSFPNEKKLTYQLFFFFHVKDVLNSTTSCIRKKRGPSHGPSKLPDGKKCKMSTYEYGQPNSGDEDCKTLVNSIGIMNTSQLSTKTFGMCHIHL